MSSLALIERKTITHRIIRLVKNNLVSYFDDMYHSAKRINKHRDFLLRDFQAIVRDKAKNHPDDVYQKFNMKEFEELTKLLHYLTNICKTIYGSDTSEYSTEKFLQDVFINIAREFYNKAYYFYDTVTKDIYNANRQQIERVIYSEIKLVLSAFFDSVLLEKDYKLPAPATIPTPTVVAAATSANTEVNPTESEDDDEEDDEEYHATCSIKSGGGGNVENFDADDDSAESEAESEAEETQEGGASFTSGKNICPIAITPTTTDDEEEKPEMKTISLSPLASPSELSRAGSFTNLNISPDTLFEESLAADNNRISCDIIKDDNNNIAVVCGKVPAVQEADDPDIVDPDIVTEAPVAEEAEPDNKCIVIENPVNPEKSYMICSSDVDDDEVDSPRKPRNSNDSTTDDDEREENKSKTKMRVNVITTDDEDEDDDEEDRF